MKLSDLKPGIYRGSYRLFEITKVEVVVSAQLNLESSNLSGLRSESHFCPNTKLVRVYPVRVSYDNQGNASLAAQYGLDEFQSQWITLGKLSTYEGTREEYLARLTADKKAQIAAQNELERAEEALADLAVRIYKHLKVGTVDSFVVSERHQVVRLDTAAATKLIQLLDMGAINGSSR